MLQRGDHIDEWVVEAALGHGGMGSVYRCHHKDAPSIRVAVKVLADALRNDEDAQARFIREAEILHRLDHPGVVKIQNIRVDHDPPFLEMEFVEGDTLEDVLEHGRIDLDAAVSWGVALFEALVYLHEHEVQHRDIKPANVLVEHQTGRLVLVDFGLALGADMSRLTSHGVAFGTVAYAPPEWLNPDTLDPVSWDLYAGGVLLWEMITGRVPYPASGIGAPRQQALQVMLSKQSAPPLDPGEGHPPLLRVIIRELSHPKPDHRPRLASDVLDRLHLVQNELRVGWDADQTPASVSRSFPVADLITEVPAPARQSGANELPSQPVSVQEPPWRWVLLALVLVASLAAGVWGYQSRSGAVRPDDVTLSDARGGGLQQSRGVVIRLSGGVEPAMLDLRLDGQPGTVADDQVMFSDVALGPQSLSWAYGKDCRTDVCPGTTCRDWCFAESKVITIEAGDNDQAFDHRIAVPTRAITVRIPSLDLDEKRGLFKRREPPVLVVRLSGQDGEITGNQAVFHGVVPGPHLLEVALGDCPQESMGCNKRGDCPEHCSSATRTQSVPWGTGPKLVSFDVPLPE